MKRVVILAGIAFLIAGLACGYLAGYLVYEPQIESYQLKVSDLTSEVSSLKQTVSTQLAKISDLGATISNQQGIISSQEETISVQVAQISSQEAKISALESETTRLESELGRAEERTQYYKRQVDSLETRLSEAQGRMVNLLGITVTQHYEWVYGWKAWQWDLPIPLSIYVEYLERPRPYSFSEYVDMARDPLDDAYIDDMVQQINDAALKERFTEVEKLNFVIAFVQSLPYTVDVETKPWNEYPRYPIETLFDRGGDCEDTSILVAALLDRMGYDVALLILENAEHMAVGVSLTTAYGSYYEFDGKYYFYLETTGEGWEVGQLPPEISDTTAYIYPLRG